jgi:hypothetical protein
MGTKPAGVNSIGFNVSVHILDPRQPAPAGRDVEETLGSFARKSGAST